MGKLTKVWTGTEWVNISPAAYGPIGPTGPVGPTGPSGGDTGPTGPSGDMNLFFLIGV